MLEPVTSYSQREQNIRSELVKMTKATVDQKFYKFTFTESGLEGIRVWDNRSPYMCAVKWIPWLSQSITQSICISQNIFVTSHCISSPVKAISFRREVPVGNWKLYPLHQEFLLKRKKFLPSPNAETNFFRTRLSALELCPLPLI